ncbi:UvrD-helicase domain-containing protein [Mangrovimonas spongiae]|uniref:DNA 3'-5' helicase n=1 Tax=Mangrovimonas spongiae TaxID=2494697 RepID=A0A428K5B6_9FLAO|nr:UvrD-helicase domain-containing protein [Mangrovimonas spongiae]RSK41611.1 DNA helicase UvrD [Mangrovimonas spongiae]
MPQQDTFTIYNASAGSGKTYTLVKNYLQIILASNSALKFRTLLALTFTNKAVNEMKSRIIETLKLFSEESILMANHPMFNDLTQELRISSEELHEKSKKLLQTMVHNYAAFDISTIDKFNHRLIRTFAHDLKLPVNFEVELDTTYLLGKAVDLLIEEAGTNKELTKILVDFAIEKADDDRSWNIAYDFNQIAKLLINENDIPYINELKGKTVTDFANLKTALLKTQKEKSNYIINQAKNALELIEAASLEHNDFSRGSLPKYFTKLSNKNFKDEFTAAWQKDLVENNTLYPKRVPDMVANTINEIQPQLAAFFETTKTAITEYNFLKNCIKNITPLSVIHAISETLDNIKKEDDLLLISEFNTIIHNEIKQQPAPFIYERLGEKFKHYFIDEFQDTSILQWTNLTPLISHALSNENLKGETGTAMLVGDAKQAIYRWRGGRAEQFIDLYTKTVNPFQVNAKEKSLDYNFRSTKTIVEFNNTLFKHLSGFVFSNPNHAAIYQASEQKTSIQETGYVELSFLDVKDQDKDELHCEKTLQIVQKALKENFALGDICIITRKGKEGVAIAEYLNNEGLNVVSSESLLLSNASEVLFIVDMFQLSLQPKNNETKFATLTFIAEHILNINDKHNFYAQYIDLNPVDAFNQLCENQITFNFNDVSSLPIYEATESIIRAFNLCEKPNAYVQFFLDEILDYSHKHDASISGFLELWDRKKDKLSIAAPQQSNAIQIMTIHKSKGLEFPVVIFPYANQDVYFDLSPKVWFPLNPEEFHGLPCIYINKNKELETYGNIGQQLYTNYQSELELDAINLLYVVLTRAVEQLYVISELDFDRKNQENIKKYSGLLINYLKANHLWNDNETEYSFGDSKRTLQPKNKQTTKTLERFISTPREQHRLKIVTNSGYLWDTNQEAAIEKGNLIHNIMANIKTQKDVPLVFKDYITKGKITPTQELELQEMVLQIINHPKLTTYFSNQQVIYNEKDIITKDGTILRPDRLTIDKNQDVTILDYKTGQEEEKHQVQIERYHNALIDMGYNVTKKILIYINQDITVKEL